MTTPKDVTQRVASIAGNLGILPRTAPSQEEKTPEWPVVEEMVVIEDLVDSLVLKIATTVASQAIWQETAPSLEKILEEIPVPEEDIPGQEVQLNAIIAMEEVILLEIAESQGGTIIEIVVIEEEALDQDLGLVEVEVGPIKVAEEVVDQKALKVIEEVKEGVVKEEKDQIPAEALVTGSIRDKPVRTKGKDLRLLGQRVESLEGRLPVEVATLGLLNK